MTERHRAVDVVAGAAGGSLITYLLTSVEKVKAAEAPPGVDQETWEMFTTLMESTVIQAQQLQELVVVLNNLTVALGGAVPGVDPFENTEKIFTGHVICNVANQAFQLPPIVIPKNKQIVVKAMPGNITWIWVGVSRSEAQDLNIAYPLVPNEGIGYFVKNADQIWVMTATVNDGVAFTVEQE